MLTRTWQPYPALAPYWQPDPGPALRAANAFRFCLFCQRGWFAAPWQPQRAAERAPRRGKSPHPGWCPGERARIATCLQPHILPKAQTGSAGRYYQSNPAPGTPAWPTLPPLLVPPGTGERRGHPQARGPAGAPGREGQEQRRAGRSRWPSARGRRWPPAGQKSGVRA